GALAVARGVPCEAVHPLLWCAPGEEEAEEFAHVGDDPLVALQPRPGVASDEAAHGALDAAPRAAEGAVEGAGPHRRLQPAELGGEGGEERALHLLGRGEIVARAAAGEERLFARGGL